MTSLCLKCSTLDYDVKGTCENEVFYMDHFILKKRVNSFFSMEKSETLKKYFFSKVLQTDHFLFAHYLFPNGNKK